MLLDVHRSGCEEVQLQLAGGWLALEGAAGDCCSQLRVALRPGGAAGRAMALHAPHGPVSAPFKVRGRGHCIKTDPKQIAGNGVA